MQNIDTAAPEREALFDFLEDPEEPNDVTEMYGFAF